MPRHCQCQIIPREQWDWSRCALGTQHIILSRMHSYSSSGGIGKTDNDDDADDNDDDDEKEKEKKKKKKKKNRLVVQVPVQVPPSLRYVSFNLSHLQRLSNMNIVPNKFRQVRQMQYQERKPDCGEIILISFFSYIPLLQCLILTGSYFTEDALCNILNASKGLLELRLDKFKIEKMSSLTSTTSTQTIAAATDSEELNQNYSYYSKEEAIQLVPRIIQSHPSLHLLKITNKLTVISKRAAHHNNLILDQIEWNIDLNELKASSSRCAKMLQDADRISWIDLVTLTQSEIKKRIAADNLLQ